MFAAERASMLTRATETLARELQLQGVKIVLAESCTAGLVAAALASVAGISEHFCGSAVTYRSDTKLQWLGVSADTLKDPGPVSETVTRQMVRGVLERTPEADWAAAITGHLGPHAPEGMDGLLFLGVGAAAGEIFVTSRRLPPMPRVARQQEAAAQLMELAAARMQV